MNDQLMRCVGRRLNTVRGAGSWEVSMIALFDVRVSTLIDGLPGSASGLL
jgi:hypothetical protein